MERWCIGEEIHNAFRIFVVAIPEDLNEYIRVSSISVLCIDGTFYYDNNTAETVNAWETEKRALTPEWARKFIYGYREGMKLTVAYGFFNRFATCKADREKEDRSNERLQRRLSQMTGYDFYRKSH